jgi:hypothetical protein
VILLILILCLLGLAYNCSINGKTLSKTWIGATGSVHDIVITVGGQIVWNTEDLPANKSMVFTPILHGTPYSISWTDVWGSHSETGTVDCDQENVERVVNDIPTPKLV